MRSLISTLASTAAPIVSTKPAMPGRVSVALNTAMMPRIMNAFTSSAIDA